MDFRGDLADIIVSSFAECGISFPENANVDDLVQRYLEMRIRRIEPIPRKVHFSEEIHDSLGELVRNDDADQRAQAIEAWGTVFYLNYLFERGFCVMSFQSKMSKRKGKVTDTETTDLLLWDYGMHHLHLSRSIDNDGFVRRSDWLLMVIVSNDDVYFVDVRPHQDAEPKPGHSGPDMTFVRQNLLEIVQANRPALIESSALYGVSGTDITDREKWELRRKRVNSAPNLGGSAIAPLAGGVAGDGHSVLCTYLAHRLLHLLDWLQRSLESAFDQLQAEFGNHGLASGAHLDFKLVERQAVNLVPDDIQMLCSSDSVLDELWNAGFAVIETNTRSVVVF
ncbi:MAG: hypothetical protein J4G13_11910 [Dehalococcoidia bacterium]|nr:hypothetical protein [Dehalococcoidia bacterium]